MDSNQIFPKTEIIDHLVCLYLHILIYQLAWELMLCMKKIYCMDNKLRARIECELTLIEGIFCMVMVVWNNLIDSS